MTMVIGSAEDFPPGSMKRVILDNGEALVVGNAEGTFFALMDECSHGEASLSEGELSGCEITCPLHAGSFDVRTGKATRRPAKRPQPAFLVEVRDGVLLATALASPSQTTTAVATQIVENTDTISTPV